jgi:adenylate cyclase class IV
MVRAKFENRIRLSASTNKFETLELMLEQALFEEEQNQIQKARKVYENLQSEISPDCLKTLMAQLSFEKRQNNVEKVKELYFRAYNIALERQASE